MRHLITSLSFGAMLLLGFVFVVPAETVLAAKICTCTGEIQSSLCSPSARYSVPVPGTIDLITMIRPELEKEGVGCTVAATILESYRSEFPDNGNLNVTEENCELTQSATVNVAGENVTYQVLCALIGEDPVSAIPQPGNDQPPATPILSPDLAQDIKNINQLGTTDVSVLFGRLAGFSFGIIGMLALMMFIWGGFVFMTSTGNPEKIKKAFLIFVWTGLGVFMFFATYAILNFFFTAF
jgi:hypothetical protein